MKTIKGKILTVVIAGLLVITAAVSAVAVSMTHEIMHKDADRILNNMTQKEAAYINDALGDVSKSAEIMEHYALGEIESIDQLADLEFRENYLQKTRLMFQEIALNTKGIEGFYLRLNPKITDSTTGYYNLVENNNTIKQMQVTDLSVYAEDDTRNVGWYYIPIKEGKATWLKPYYFPGHAKQMITYAMPIYVDSELLGVIGFNMDFELLVERIDSISVYKDGYAVLLASDGVTRYNNQEKEASAEPYSKAEVELQNGMFLELRADYKDIQRDIRPMMSNIVLAFLLVLICAIIYTVIVTNRITRLLNHLMAAAQKISAGEELENNAVVVTSEDEIGTLYKVLNSTYEKMQEYTSYINALAYRDSLTGIKNSTAYTEATEKLAQLINCGNPQFGVLVADINNLKQTNDRFGHDIGDELIVHTAKILTDIFKTSSVFRIGGDEFAVILAGKDYDNYRTLVMCLDEACAKDYVTVCESKIPVVLARGVSIYDPTIDRVYKDVFAKADHAMYMHKEQSKSATIS